MDGGTGILPELEQSNQERTGAAPASSIALEHLPGFLSQVQGGHGKSFQEIQGFEVGKE